MTYQQIHIGIDPGSSSGGIAVLYLNEGDAPRVSTHQLKNMTMKDMATLFLELKGEAEGGKIHAVVEKVNAVFGSSAKAMFSFGGSYHAILMGLTMAEIPFEVILPSRWMTEFHMKKAKGEGKPAWKLRLKEKAEMIFPNVPLVMNTSDALLIAEFCRRINREFNTKPF